MNLFKEFWSWPQPWWSQKRIDRAWEKYWEPIIEEECQKAFEQELKARAGDSKKMKKVGQNMSFDEYQEEAGKTAKFPDDVPPLFYNAAGLCDEAGEVMGVVKKFYRDREALDLTLDRDKLVKELGDTLWYLSQAARMAQITLGEVAETNIEKLRGRRARNTIHGEGDER